MGKAASASSSHLMIPWLDQSRRDGTMLEVCSWPEKRPINRIEAPSVPCYWLDWFPITSEPFLSVPQTKKTVKRRKKQANTYSSSISFCTASNVSSASEFLDESPNRLLPSNLLLPLKPISSLNNSLSCIVCTVKRSKGWREYQSR